MIALNVDWYFTAKTFRLGRVPAKRCTPQIIAFKLNGIFRLSGKIPLNIATDKAKPICFQD